jgi:hypothetical protein
MFRFTIKQLLVATCLCALGIGVFMFCWNNLAQYNRQIGEVCILIFGSAPIVGGIVGYRIDRRYSSIAGIGIGVLISGVAFSILGHIVLNYWAG